MNKKTEEELEKEIEDNNDGRALMALGNAVRVLVRDGKDVSLENIRGKLRGLQETGSAYVSNRAAEALELLDNPSGMS